MNKDITNDELEFDNKDEMFEEEEKSKGSIVTLFSVGDLDIANVFRKKLLTCTKGMNPWIFVQKVENQYEISISNQYGSRPSNDEIKYYEEIVLNTYDDLCSVVD
jgi:hypothetical protein